MYLINLRDFSQHACLFCKKLKEHREKELGTHYGHTIRSNVRLNTFNTNNKCR